VPAGSATPPAAPPVIAEAPPPPPPDFYHADTNFDAKISFEEAQKIWPQLTHKEFDAADLDGSGSLSADEYNLLVKHPPPLHPRPDQQP
jgi:EF hand